MVSDRPPTGRHPGVSRRSLLQGAAALGVVGTVGGLGLAACGGDDDAVDTASDPTGPVTGDLSLVAMLDAASSLAAGESARVPLGLADLDGALVSDGPATIRVSVQDDAGDEIETVEAPRRAEGLTQAFYPVVFTPAAPGFHRLVAEVDGSPVEAIVEVSDAADIAIPRVGQPLPVVATPTVADSRGVDPICTQEPACPLHEVDLADALGAGPVAVLVSTPAFCQTAICGPVLDLFVAAAEDHPETTFVHVEVYASAAEVEEQGLQAPLAPAVDEWGLPFEPCLFLVGSDGSIVERLDVIYDAVELDEGLARLA